MKHSMKAALLSALVFPGLGQIFVGFKKRGLVFICITMLLLFLIVREIIQKASPVIAEMVKMVVQWILPQFLIRQQN